MPTAYDLCANCSFVFGQHSFVDFNCPGSSYKFSPLVSPAAKTIPSPSMPPTQYNTNDVCVNCRKTYGLHYILGKGNGDDLYCDTNGHSVFFPAKYKPTQEQVDAFLGKRITKAINTARTMASKPIDEEERLTKILTGVRVGECACKIPRHQCIYHKD